MNPVVPPSKSSTVFVLEHPLHVVTLSVEIVAVEETKLPELVFVEFKFVTVDVAAVKLFVVILFEFEIFPEFKLETVAELAIRDVKDAVPPVIETEEADCWAMLPSPRLDLAEAVDERSESLLS